MESTSIEVRRQAQELGRFSAEEIHTLLDAAFLLPTDEFKFAGESNWAKLSTFSCLGPTSSLATRIRTAVAKATRPASQFLGDVSARTGKLAESQKDALLQVSQRVLVDYLPQLREKTLGELSTWQRSTSSALGDEVFLRKLFGAVYDTIPKPIYRFVSEEQFVGFCFKHRQRLLGATGGKIQE